LDQKEQDVNLRRQIAYWIVPLLVLFLVGCQATVPQEEYDQVVADLAASQAEVTRLEDEMTALQGELEDAQGQIDSLQQELDDLQNQGTDAELQLRDLRKELIKPS
jgi:peptidoglycan hydrolase CwlO-like protein